MDGNRHENEVHPNIPTHNPLNPSGNSDFIFYDLHTTLFFLLWAMAIEVRRTPYFPKITYRAGVLFRSVYICSCYTPNSVVKTKLYDE